MRIINHRTSRKQVNDLAEAFGFELIVIQCLGDRKDYWYQYTIVNKDTREALIRRATLKDCFDAMLKEADRIVESWELGDKQ